MNKHVVSYNKTFRTLCDFTEFLNYTASDSFRISTFAVQVSLIHHLKNL